MRAVIIFSLSKFPYTKTYVAYQEFTFFKVYFYHKHFSEFWQFLIVIYYAIYLVIFTHVSKITVLVFGNIYIKQFSWIVNVLKLLFHR